MRIYLRDGRSPIPIHGYTSKVMSANKGKNTKPELILRKKLWAHNLKGYRLNYKKIPGRPDIVFVFKKLAIFVHGCYWHRCPVCNLNIPKSNSSFWKTKFEKNIERDKRKSDELTQLGWQVLVIWECEINKDMNKQIELIGKSLR